VEVILMARPLAYTNLRFNPPGLEVKGPWSQVEADAW